MPTASYYAFSIIGYSLAFLYLLYIIWSEPRSTALQPWIQGYYLSGKFIIPPRVYTRGFLWSGLKKLEKDDKQFIWHPFTQMKDWDREKPLIIEEGKGSYLKDIHGKRYIDGVSSLWVNLHGHRKRQIDNAIIRQIKKISHSTLLGLSNPPAIILAKELIRIAPKGLKRVFYSDNGSTAVEVGLKIAFQYWQEKGGKGLGSHCCEAMQWEVARGKRTKKSGVRGQRSGVRKTKFISFTGAYHGDTLGSLSVGGIDIFVKKYRPLLFPAYRAYYPYCYRCPIDKEYPDCKISCIKRFEEILKDHHNEIAACIIEPIVQGAAGMVVSPPGFLKRVRELCTKYGILLIADEVAVGFGRTGRMFACEHEGVSPDILCLAKGITGGYLPLAATLTTQEIYNAFLGEYREFKTFFHGHTYTGNPLACAAAIANLEVFKKEKTLQQLKPKIRFLEMYLKKFWNLPHVGDIRQRGLIAGIELVKNRGTKEPYPLEEKIGIKITLEARKKGLIVRPLGNVIVIMPPLSISINELRKMVDIIYNSIETAIVHSP